MTTYYPFTPSIKTAPTFVPTLDGQQYTCTVTWNLQGQRYYLNVSTLQGVRLLTIAIVETPPAVPVQSVTYVEASNIATMTCAKPHGIGIGRLVSRAVAGCTPIDYDGTYTMMATSATTLTYAPATIPAGPSTVQGSVSAVQSLVDGYFASTLIYRAGRFEVSP